MQNIILGIVCALILIAVSLPGIIVALKNGQRTRKLDEWILAAGICWLIFWLVQLFIY